MGKKSGPTPPPAPDPTVTSKAQSDANIATAREQQRLNLINTYGPNGSVVYAADPNAPGGYSQTTNLSPAEQSIYDAQKATELGATNIARDQLGRVQNALQTPLDTTGLQQLSGGVDLSGLNPGSGIRSSFNQGGPLQYGFDQGQQVQGSVGGNQDLARLVASEANYRQAASRLDPRFDKAEDRERTRLAAQGFSENSQGYRDAMSEFGRSREDAYNQAILSSIREGEAAAQGQFGRELAQGQFANDAAGQQYQQGLGSAAFNNQTAGQDYQQNLGAAQFGNQAQQQAYQQQLSAVQAALANAQFGNEARNQGLQERAYLQNQPVNQLTGLLSLGQVGMPQGIDYSPTQIANTDVLGAYALQNQAQQAAYQAQMQNRSGMLGGLFQLGSAALLAGPTGGASLIGSDRRLKTNVRRVGTLDNGVPVYSYRYKAGGPPQIGVMAQELAQVRPDLVHDMGGGILGVDYSGLAEAA